MALMPDDLLSKRFTPVRFSEGYDMDEVDNYLDNDILPRLQELIDENSRLTKELEEAHNRLAEAESAPASADAAAAPDAPAAADMPAEAEETDSDEVIDETPVSSTSAQDEGATAQQAVVEDAPVEEEPAAAPAPAAETPDQSAAGIIALANRLHDEHVKNGEDERDRLITEANDEHKRIIGEAEETSRTTLADLETKKAELDKTIEGLRNFERDYRNRLRNYLENQLRDLDTSETQDKQANFGL
ncbi:DivIVA domain-containing protein [Brachybacterium fresconis]|uniref:Cell wall synthesis protein Wag31 n=1 Tax=Brachybacterium fresconis TaxID=173363 RepID=A0ABS4YPW1_9MICO|nr:DivIVA domain-containing protein [Brachybacterium fresconis]MBP2410831.1 DivIVA domain-containing protein [Brachybacterium fresconis]